jgi:hypothetical protein
MSEKELQFFKLVAVGAALLYLYKASKASGSTLAGNPYAQVQSDQVVKLASQFVPREWRGSAVQLGNAIMERIQHV